MSSSQNPPPAGQPFPAPDLSIEQALQMAAQQIDAGCLPEAEALAKQVLQAQPGNPFAMHLLGVIAHLVGRTELAVKLIGQAIDAMPTVAHFHRNRGEMCRLLKRLDEAVKHGEWAASLAPDDAVAHSNLGIAWYDRKEYDKAEARQRRALALQPNLAQALNNLGSIQRDRKDKEGAVAFYRQALSVAPDYLEARNNLGAVLTELDRPEEALAELLPVIQARPGYPDAHCNIGSAFLYQERFDEAWSAFTHALSLDAESVTALVGQARVRKEQDRLDEALEISQRAQALDPERPEVHTLLADIHVKAERYEAAEVEYRDALARDSAYTPALLGFGQLYLELGRMTDAEAMFAQAGELSPEDVSPHVSMVHARKVKDGDASLARLETESFDDMSPSRAMLLHFALGKAYDDLKRYDEAFPHFLEATRLKRARIQYNADDHDLTCRRIAGVFTQENIERLRGAGDPSHAPIFVLGMPRSGTTLVETIIASHPDVYGAGELHDLLHIANHPIEGEDAPAYPLSMDGITQEQLTQMGERYIASIRERAPGAPHVTDKMPANFLALGLIHLMLPNAKIVHVRRNPVDICLSGFTKMFQHSQHHSYDLIEIGRYYVAYANLMAHWCNVLPAGDFLEIQYEELVADPENQTRRLIEHCGLEWNDACLQHHKTERSVKTASITQVRQPVYQSSVERWRHYEKHLGPLIETLREGGVSV